MFGRRSPASESAPPRAPTPAVAITNFRGVTDTGRKTPGHHRAALRAAAPVH